MFPCCAMQKLFRQTYKGTLRDKAAQKPLTLNVEYPQMVILLTPAESCSEPALLGEVPIH